MTPHLSHAHIVASQQAAEFSWLILQGAVGIVIVLSIIRHLQKLNAPYRQRRLKLYAEARRDSEVLRRELISIESRLRYVGRDEDGDFYCDDDAVKHLFAA